jgi:hypothetical protein
MASHKSVTSAKQTAAAAMHVQAEADWTIPSSAPGVQGSAGSVAGIPHAPRASSGIPSATGTQQVDLQVGNTALSGHSSGRSLRSNASVPQTRE